MNRYKHHDKLPEFSNKGQEKLKQAKVLVVGAGGLGTPILFYLAGAGIGHIGIIDHDQIELSNLHRQILYREKDVGFYKAEVAARELSLLNRDTTIQSYIEKLTPFNIQSIIDDYDLVIDGTDNFDTTYLINDACALSKKTLIYGAIQQFSGMVATFKEGHGCYRCLYPEKPQHNIGNCSEIGVVGPLPGVIGSLQALEAMKYLIKKDSDTKLIHCQLWDHQYQSLNFNQDPDCQACGNSPSITEIHPQRYGYYIPKSRWLNYEDVKQDQTANWIDIRDQEEFAQGSLPYAKNIPLGQLSPDMIKSKAYVFCQTGKRCESLWKLKFANKDHIYFIQDAARHYHSNIQTFNQCH